MKLLKPVVQRALVMQNRKLDSLFSCGKTAGAVFEITVQALEMSEIADSKVETL